MRDSLTLGRIAGIRFGVNWSWLIVFALIVWTLATAIDRSNRGHVVGSSQQKAGRLVGTRLPKSHHQTIEPLDAWISLAFAM